MATVDELQARIVRLETEQRHMMLLQEIAQELNAAQNGQDLLRTLVKPLLRTGVSSASLNTLCCDSQNHPYQMDTVAIWQGSSESSVTPGASYPLENFPMTRLWLEAPNVPFFSPDIVNDDRVDPVSRALNLQLGVRANVVLPLMHGGEWVGIVFWGWSDPHPFDTDEQAYYALLPLVAAPAVRCLCMAETSSQQAEEIAQLRQTEATLREREQDLITIQNISQTGYWVNNLRDNHLYWSDRVFQLFGRTRKDITPDGIMAWVHPDDRESFLHEAQRYVREKSRMDTECRVVWPDGSIRWIRSRGEVVCDAHGNAIKTMGTVRDITERRQAEAERDQLLDAIIQTQRETLRALSTPVIPVMEHILIMPLVGQIDADRARDIMRALLDGIGKYRAKTVVLDVTGVPVIDTQVAEHLNKTIQAARLKGTHTIISGISDAVAETIIDLGIDWGDVETVSSLQSGLGVALKQVGLKLQKTGAKDNLKRKKDSLRGKVE